MAYFVFYGERNHAWTKLSFPFLNLDMVSSNIPVIGKEKSR